MADQETFYNLRLPMTLKKWSTTFEKHERSQILRAFIAVMISMATSADCRRAILMWANGQRTLTLPAPCYLKGVVTPAILKEATVDGQR